MSVGHREVTTGDAPYEPVMRGGRLPEDCGSRDVQDRLGDQWSVMVFSESDEANA